MTDSRQQTTSAKRVRTCIGCGASSTKNDLIRIVRSADGGVSLDVKGNAAGRGAYVCSEACFEKALARKQFNRALKMQITDADTQQLRTQFAAAAALAQD